MPSDPLVLPGQTADHASDPATAAPVDPAKSARESRKFQPIPGYQPEEQLGEGTFGAVWLYRQNDLGRRVAVKFFSRGDERARTQALEEAQKISKYHGVKGIIQIDHVETDVDPPYYIMAHAERGPLAARLAGKCLDMGEALRIFRELCAALAYVHARNICHCDLKPGNVLFDSMDQPLICDFGQAAVCNGVSMSLGTFFYMAPEQADLDNAIPDTRWDVYALGAILYAMLTGAPPRENPQLREKLERTESLPSKLLLYRDAIRSAPPPTGHVDKVDDELAAIVDKCLAIEPEKRYETASQVMAALRDRDRLRWRRPLQRIVIAISCVLMAAIGITAYSEGHKALNESQKAMLEQDQKDSRLVSAIIAKALHDRLESRSHWVANKAKDPEIIDLLAELASNRLVPEKAYDRLGDRLKVFDGQLTPERRTIYSWHLSDAKGCLVGIYDPSGADKSLLGKRFAFRDWFSGAGDDLLHQDMQAKPIEHVHLSEPYMTANPSNPQLAISVAAPVFKQGKVLGVLVGNMQLDNLHRWLSDVSDGNNQDYLVAIYDRRGFCLLHPRKDRIEPAQQTRATNWRVQWDDASGECQGKFLHALDDREHGGTLDDFCDPVSAGPEKSYAGYAPFNVQVDTSSQSAGQYTVFMQKQEEYVLKPIKDLGEKLRKRAIGLVLAGVGFTTGLSWWLLRALRRQEGLAGG